MAWRYLWQGFIFGGMGWDGMVDKNKIGAREGLGSVYSCGGKVFILRMVSGGFEDLFVCE